MNKNTICRYVAHIYVICSIVGMALLVSFYNIAVAFLGIGASSVYIALGVFLSANVSRFWGISAALYGTILFPVLLIVSYIFALKGRYKLLFVAIAVDLLVVILFAAYTLLTNNGHGFHLAIIDIVISFFVMIIFAKALRMTKK